MDLSPSHAEVWADLILYRSYACTHSASQFMFTLVMSCLEHTISLKIPLLVTVLKPLGPAGQSVIRISQAEVSISISCYLQIYLL